MSLKDSEYTAYFVEMVSREPSFKDLFESPKERAARLAQWQGNQFPRPPFQQQSFPNGQGPNRGEMYCFGCGKNGHHVRNCDEIATLINKGVIIRDSYTGKLQWPDGSWIFRSGEETWAQAVANTKQSHLVQIKVDGDESDHAYNYLNFATLDEDSDSEDLSDMDSAPGKVRDHYAYGAEWAPKVSREARKQVQSNSSPNSSQRVKKFPQGLESQTPSRPQNPIQKNPNLNSNQTRPPKRLTPVDVHQNKFEGKSDNQFLPMQADQEVTAKSGNNPGKNPPHQGQTSIPKVSNPGSNRCRDSLAIAKSILDIPLTLTLQEAVYISPRFRKDLVNVVKQEHEPLPPVQEKTTLVNEIASDNEPSDDQPQETFCRRAEVVPEKGEGEIRDSLLKIPATISGIPMTGIFDCGSQVSVISRRLADAAGLLWSSDKKSRVKLITVGGKPTWTLGKFPNAKIWLTDSKLPTNRDLYINPGDGFDLLMGRTFGSRKKVNLKERKDGTYLSFKSWGKFYKFNACPSNHRRIVDDEGEDGIDWDWNGKNRVCVATIKVPEEQIKNKPKNELGLKVTRTSLESYPTAKQMRPQK